MKIRGVAKCRIPTRPLPNKTSLPWQPGGTVADKSPEAEAAAQAAAQAATEAQAAADAAAAAEAQAAADAAAAAEAAAKAKDKETGGASADIVAFLKGQVKEHADALVQAAVDKRALEAKIATMEASHDGLLAIARDSINNMQVAFGGSKSDLSKLDAVAVLAQHKELSDKFTKQFKVGGVAATAPADSSTKQEETAASPMQQARLRAVRLG
jgi:hypothetical protein